MSGYQISNEQLKQKQISCSTYQHEMLRTSTMSQPDLIATSFDVEIETYKAESLSNFIQIGTVLLQPADDAFEVFASDQWIGFNKYVFDAWSPRKKAVEVHLSGRKTRVYIKHLGEWKTVARYLSLLEPAKPTSAAPSWDVLWAWWSINGKTFRFLDFPPEVRDLVYEHFYGLCVHPYPNSKTRGLGPRTFLFKAAQPGRELMKVNIQISREARDVLFLRTPFRLERFGLIAPVLRNLAQRIRIRRLDLALSHVDFFRLFGLKIAGARIYQISGRVQALRHMQLTSLRLHIAPPSFANESDNFDGACQVIVVKWLLDAAWRWVRGHPVVATGYIKDAQKVDFEALCKQEQKRLASWKLQVHAIGGDADNLVAYDEWLSVAEADGEGGIRLNGEQDKELRTNEINDSVMLPPRCICETPCTLQAWSPV